jgi:hypothetical protein
MLPLSAPPLNGTWPLKGHTTPSSDFEKHFVDGFALGNGAIDYFAVNVILDDDVLHGAGFFCGAGNIERCQPSQYAEDMSGNFQHVSIHIIQPFLDPPQQRKPDYGNSNRYRCLDRSVNIPRPTWGEHPIERG